MRVIAGSARRIPLVAPEGKNGCRTWLADGKRGI